MLLWPVFLNFWESDAIIRATHGTGVSTCTFFPLTATRRVFFWVLCEGSLFNCGSRLTNIVSRRNLCWSLVHVACKSKHWILQNSIFPTKLGVHSDLRGCVPGKLGASMQAFCSSALQLLLLMQKSCRPFRRVFEKDDKRSSTALGTGSCMQSYPVVPFWSLPG
jgi:hypothetical protein